MQLTFDSGFGKQIKITLSDNRRKQQSRYLPEELVKDFSVALLLDRKTVAEREITGNCQRLCRVAFENVLCDSVKITFKTTHGCPEARVFEVRIK